MTDDRTARRRARTHRVGSVIGPLRSLSCFSFWRDFPPLRRAARRNWRTQGGPEFIKFLGGGEDRDQTSTIASRSGRIILISTDAAEENAPRGGGEGSALPQGGAERSAEPTCPRSCGGNSFILGSTVERLSPGENEPACSNLCQNGIIELPEASADAFYPSAPRGCARQEAGEGERKCAERQRLEYLLRHDETLRQGDIVMTSGGFMVFRGVGRPPFTQNDFAPLALAVLPREERALLGAIENATLAALPRPDRPFLEPSADEVVVVEAPRAKSGPDAAARLLRFVDTRALTNK